ncbi:Serine/threonine-protein kinase BUR1 [Cladobotryum mycophilum]|uniref:Serine/threonine-protein kinase BUR1 n=1 Tax=Cladobotryum mycophilum TaxID=491253 RepID=A0ABR0SM18_9HYPO
MEQPSENTPDGTSPRTFALNHLRPKSSFQGCSRISDYELQGKLGEGTFGEVHRARSRKTGALVALKKIIMHHEKDGFPITALREIKLLKLLSHHNILKLEDMAVEHPTKATDKRKKPIMYMVTPYMDHDLSGLLDNPSVHFKEAQIKCYMLQLLQGLRYLHDNHILHRDMKAANLLINNKGILQIADFGLARHYDGPTPRPNKPMGDGRRDYTGLVVTRWYRPPELLLQLRQYTTAIDVWGVGCVFGEMLFGKPILAGESDAHQLEIIWDLMGSPTDENMPGYGPGAIALLKDLLKLDWKTRINAVDALEHPYFKKEPLPMEPHQIPTYEESHELDRRKFHDRKAALPPAPKGAKDTAVEMAQMAQMARVIGGGPEERRPAWQKERGPPVRPPQERNRDEQDHRERDRPPRSRGPIRAADVDTYIPSYNRDDGGGRRRDDDRPRDDRPRDERRRPNSKEGGRRYDRDRRTRSRTRSPIHERSRDRDRADRDMYRR